MSTPLNTSILKSFKVLQLFNEQRSEISTVTLKTELGMNTATAHRFLLSLEAAGALSSYRRGYFCLSQKMDELGALARDANPLSRVAKPILDQVCLSLNESVMACSLSRSGPTCIAVATSRQPITVNISVGTVLPFFNTAQGKLWLAYMNDEERKSYAGPSSSELIEGTQLGDELGMIRQQGYALNQGDNEPDIAAISVPVFSGEGKMMLSLSLFGMLSRFDQVLIDKSRTELLEAANLIEQSYG